MNRFTRHCFAGGAWQTAHIAATWAAVATVGGIEGLFGRTSYSGDAICYLNVARAVGRGDWRAAFDPMWTIGYPALVAAAKAAASPTPEGEWYAITALNWVLFLGAYACFRWLVVEGAACLGEDRTPAVRAPLITWLGCAVFLTYGVCYSASVSRVTPDLTVSTLLLAAAAQMLRVLRRGRSVDAVVLGATLGLGCWVKGVFFSYSAIFLFVVTLALFVRRSTGGNRQFWKLPGIVAATLALAAGPYLAALSWAYGAPTLGVTGELNYAFHVNHLPHWTHWLGDAAGDSQFGKPLHSNEPIVVGEPAFAFAAPFSTTYPPYNNIAYWYRGFRHFFSFRNQLVALAHTGITFLAIVRQHPLMRGFLAVALALACVPAWRQAGREALRKLWPIAVASALVTLTYLAVHVEDRYLGTAFLLLTMVPVLYLTDENLPHKTIFLVGIAAIYLGSAGQELATYPRGAFLAALHAEDFHRDRDWRLAAELPLQGLRRGDGVALVPDDDTASRCTWAYLSGLHIVAEYGAIPWRIAPNDRLWLDGDPGEPADGDPAKAFWGLPEGRRSAILNGFERVGARAVVSLSRPNDTDAGWVPVGDTGAWVFSFRSGMSVASRP